VGSSKGPELATRPTRIGQVADAPGAAGRYTEVIRHWVLRTESQLPQPKSQCLIPFALVRNIAAMGKTW
jgi:hypothetical protein